MVRGEVEVLHAPGMQPIFAQSSNGVAIALFSGQPSASVLEDLRPL